MDGLEIKEEEEGDLVSAQHADKPDILSKPVRTTLKRSIDCDSPMIPSRKQPCDICGKEFTTLSALKEHKGRMHSEREDHVCDQCGKSFKCKTNLRQHMERVHSDQEFPCSDCKYVGKCQFALDYHTKVMHGDAKRFMCSECGKKYERPYLLEHHKKVVHMGLRYPCDQCDHQAKAKVHLRKHIESVHMGKTYPCELCDFVAHWSGALKTHKKTKHENQRFPCDECEEIFEWSSQLHRHKSRAHSNVRFPCSLCDSFVAINVSDYNKHMRYKHGPDQQIPCDLCGKQFRGKDNLRGHYRKVHKRSLNLPREQRRTLKPDIPAKPQIIAS